MSAALQTSSKERRRLLRQVLVPVAALIIMAVLVNVFLVLRAAELVDSERAAAQRQSVASVIKRLPSKLARFAGDYALWDEFYLEMQRPSIESWAEENLGPYIGPTFGVTETWLVSSSDEVIYGWSSDSPDPIAAYNEADGLRNFVEAARSEPDGDVSRPIAGHVVLHGKLHTAVAVVLLPSSPDLLSDPQRPRNVFVVLSDVEQTGFRELSEDFQLGGLAFSPGGGAAKSDQFPVYGLGDQVIGYLVWSPRANTVTLMTGYWQSFGLLIFSLVVAMTMLAFRWTRMIQRLESVTVTARASEEASAAKSAFIANMSHELRTPLNAIIGFSEIMAEERFGAHAVPRYRDYARDVLRSGRHLLAVINDVLSVAKIEAGQHQFSVAPCNVADVVDDVVRMMEYEARKRSVGLTVAPSSAGSCVLADETALRQILVNLVGNALKFTPAGNVEISWCNTASDMVDITVADTGIGIAADKLSQLGTPFFQVADVWVRNEGGMGLGLSIVRGMTQAMGGTMTIQSEELRGTAVRVILPAASRAAGRQSAA